MRRSLRLRPRAKLTAEERDGGVFLRPVKPAAKIEPIGYLPVGSIKLTQRDFDLEKLAGEDIPPDFSQPGEAGTKRHRKIFNPRFPAAIARRCVAGCHCASPLPDRA